MELKPCPDCAREWGVCNDVTNRFEIREARFCGTCGRPINGYLPPNPPLTLDELRQMDGDPVWIELVGEGLIPTKAWGIVNAELELASGNSFSFRFEDYYVWLAYRRRPEE